MGAADDVIRAAEARAAALADGDPERLSKLLHEDFRWTSHLGESYGRQEFRMPMTQVWVRADGRWQCLAGHAGPRLP
jgi:hypothetical protein